MTSHLRQLEDCLTLCVNSVINCDSNSTENKAEIVSDIHNHAEKFSDQLGVIRRDLTQAELIHSTQDEKSRLHSEIAVLRDSLDKKKQLIKRAQDTFVQCKIKISQTQDKAISDCNVKDGV